MILYTLKCDHGHQFESWFASATAFDSLRASGHLVCTHCGSAKVEKAMMAPAVALAPSNMIRTAPPIGHAVERPAPPVSVQSAPTHPDMAAKLAALRREIEAKAEFVGGDFATVARAIHDGDAPERPIWGEARLDEAKALLDDGIPVAPLPFLPKSKVN